MNEKMIIGLGLGVFIGMLIARNTASSDTPPTGGFTPTNDANNSFGPENILPRGNLKGIPGGIPGGYCWDNCHNFGNMAHMTI